ncbi:MAG: hypothetical protein Q9176_001050 [Flavoplaca citrina]
MVKLNCTVDSDDEFPELSTIIAEGTLSPQKRGAIIREPNSNANPPEHHVSVLHGDRQRARGKQRALKVAHVNSILLSLTDRAACSPPRVKSPSRSPPQSHVVTLPANPSKLKLPSPDKKFHIPRSPHRPSIDAFWSQEVINDWTDSYTPRKIAKPYSSRVPNTSSEDDKDFPLPRQAPRRSPSKSPSKADTEAAERRRAFNKDKYELGAAFLRELDQTIVDGQITRLAEPAGGVQLLWSKKLQSTAGRANWRREAIRSKDGEVTSTTYRHFASIELAEKVIDDEGDYEPYHQWTEQESTRSLTRLIDRLINVICHEYCHLLTFMMSNVKDNPHGKEFKTWAKKCSTAYAHRGVNVTTTHVYEISYKYIWECSKCGTAYKRHSKSIDPTRHSCGKCHEKLLQVKPTPRGNGKGISDYQKFVKEHFARLKRERPEMNMGEVMTALGREYREAREKGIGDMVLQVDEGPKVGRDENAGLEAVVRKLDLLAMGTDGERSNL